MATSTATRTKQESRIQMRPKYPQQQPGQPFFLRQVPASLTPGPARLTARLRRKSGPIIQPTVQIKMRPEYLPPLVIPLRKSSSSHRISQLQQQQRVPCPVYRPEPIHPIPALPAPTYAPPPPPPPSSQQSPTQAEIHELPGDIPSPTPQTPNHHHPDSAMSLNLEPIPMTESPQPVGGEEREGGGKGTAYLSDHLDQETLATLKAYYRHTLHLSPAPIPSPSRAAGQSSSPQLGNSTSPFFESNNKKEKNKLHRSSAIYVRNPHAAAAANANPSTKSNQRTTATRRRRTAVFPSWSWRAESKHQQDSDRHHLQESEFQVRFQTQNQNQTQNFSAPAEPLSIQPTPDIIEGIVSSGGRTTRLDTYTSVLDDWERDMIDARLDTKEEEEESHQPAEELVNEFGEREKEALKDLMGFLDEVLGCSSAEESEEQTVQVACGLEEGSLWWRDVRRSLV
ncbi:hypothetical protein QBC42DRAFT_80616 [Cladorrhinum samala]|uniref:Uncharacterized protein n=1 Tax=Cladorrhinum samala TaxID=585594 RepID=A0AAV9HNR0_9PEZI|nr:hypothetical protein QBC42DRAFT_80616 [Cladorrhinum samala]